MDPYEDIYDSKSYDGAFQKGVCDHRKDLWIHVSQIIRIPETQPGKTKQKNARLNGKNYVENLKDPDGNLGIVSEPVLRRIFFRLGWDPYLKHYEFSATDSKFRML
jgi:hypothetical protein